MNVTTVDGRLSEWSKFTTCSVSCGIGVKTRLRQCNNPAPAFGGEDCDRALHHSVICKVTSCHTHEPATGKRIHQTVYLFTYKCMHTFVKTPIYTT